MFGTVIPEGPAESPLLLLMLPNIDNGFVELRSRNDGGRFDGLAVVTKFCSPTFSSLFDIVDISCCIVSGDRRLLLAAVALSVTSSFISTTSATGLSSDFISSDVWSVEGVGASATGCVALITEVVIACGVIF